MQNDLTLFEDYNIRRVYDEATETWFFSVIDVVAALTEQNDFQTVRKYWKVLKGRLKKEENEIINQINQFKLSAANSKKMFTDVASKETLLQLIHFVPSPKKQRTLENLGFKVVKNRKEFSFGEDIIDNLFSDYLVVKQLPILNGKYKVDWYVPELKLAIEFDELHHAHQKSEDKERQHLIETELGCRFIRYKYGT
jgi:hypothetical protein